METEHVISRRVIDMFQGKGFSDVKIKFEFGPAKYDGLIGLMLHAKICAVKDGLPQEFDAVMKCAPSNETFRTILPVRNFFRRETLYYTKIVPIYNNLQDQFELCVPQEMRCLLPKCYGCCDDFKPEIIVLEDLTKKGFCVAPLHTLDYAHAAIILRTTAKLHALSFIYEDRYPKQFREMADRCVGNTLDPNDEYDETYMMLYGDKVMSQFMSAITDLSLRKKIELALGTDLVKKYKDIHGIGKVKTILHGDNWHGNYMFKYENGKPTEAVPIDFQWSRYGSIAYDFMYLFGFSLIGELRRTLFHQLMDEYYTCFQGYLSHCGYDANNFCSYQQFKEELRSQALICPASFIMIYPLFNNPVCILPEMLASSEMFAVTEEYKLRVDDLVTLWAELEFI